MDTELKEGLRKAWQAKILQERKKERERRRKALERAASAAGLLKEKYGVRKVYLYGSLL
jgi:hypothetical protein